jgi:hypothetical protein
MQRLSQPKIIPPLISLTVNFSYLNDISSHHVESNVFDEMKVVVMLRFSQYNETLLSHLKLMVLGILMKRK